MRQLFSHVVAGMLTLAAAGIAAGAPAETFEIISHSAAVDLAERTTRFTVTFNQEPDFLTIDEFNRPAKTFQYWYDAQPGGFEFAGEDVVVIRGPELRLGGGLPIRQSINETGEEFPGAEGWGALLGEAPIQLDGTTLQFTASWDTLGETDGLFTYRLAAFEFGTQTSEVVGGIFIDLPTPLKMGAIALAVTMIGLGIQRRSLR